nr:hypothetical protein GCM10020241_31460 [Streptoalloteichus tenebrarius]
MLSGLPTFLVAAFLVAITPGPATMLLIRQSAVGSWRTVLATIAGIEAGVLFWALAAVFGLSAVLVASQFAYDVLRVVGALVLVWFGAQALLAARRRPEGDVAVEVAPVPDRPWRAFHMALLTNATNPKAGVFAISFLPQFAPARAADDGRSPAVRGSVGRRGSDLVPRVRGGARPDGPVAAAGDGAAAAGAGVGDRADRARSAARAGLPVSRSLASPAGFAPN